MLARSMIASLLLLVGSAVAAQNPLGTEVRFHPATPSDNTPVTVLMAHEGDYCGWSAPELIGVTRSGRAVRIDLAAYAGFGGGLDPSTSPAARVPPKCTPPGRFLTPQEVPLGRLEIGTYELSVFLTQLDAHPEPITVQTNAVTLEVVKAPDTVRLQDERFAVTVDWTTADGSAGTGRPIHGSSDDSTLFTFFERDNWELMVKVLDGCALNGHYWVFTSAATDAGYVVSVTDSDTGDRWTDANPIGVRAPAVADTTAFPCSTDTATVDAISPTIARATSDEIVPSPLLTEVAFTPAAPTDNETVALLMAHRLNNCGWTPPVATITRDGFSLHVDLASYPGFGGGLAVDRSPKCTPAFPYLEPQRLDLGRLEPGVYTVSITLTERGADDPKTILTHRTTLEVADAPDLVPLQDGRFSTAAVWVDFEDRSGAAQPVPGPSNDSTLFTFFDDANWEVMVKVLDGCAINDHYWVFAAAATDAQYSLGVRDETNGDTWFFDNPPGVRAPAVADTTAFPCSP